MDVSPSARRFPAGLGAAAEQSRRAGRQSNARPATRQEFGARSRDGARFGRKDDLDYLVYRLSDVIVTSYQTGASAHDDSGPVDQISLGFGRVEVEYRPQKPDGSLGATVKARWGGQKNAKI